MKCVCEIDKVVCGKEAEVVYQGWSLCNKCYHKISERDHKIIASNMMFNAMFRWYKPWTW